MAKRRMFSLEIVDTDAFLDLPASSQNLYFHLGMRADDDGFVSNPKKITLLANCSADDMKLLIAKGFIIPFDSGVCVIRDWRTNNNLRPDRYHETRHLAEKRQLLLTESGVYLLLTTDGIPSVDDLATEVRIGKGRLDPSPELPDESTDKSKTKKVFEHDTNPYKAARWLADEIERRMPTCKPYTEKQIQAWAQDFDRCHRIDGHPWEEINDVLSFSQSDGFWQQNILSGGSFRRNYVKLLARMNGGKP